jgi:AcrR family transcriptional regulator
MAPRYRKDDRDQALHRTRQLLLDAAAEEFAREGYVGANINRISRAAGFAKGTVYNYFASKQALMEALIDHVAEMHLDHVAQWVEKETAPDRRLERFFEAGFGFVSQHLAPARAIITTLYGPHAAFRMHMFQAYQPMFQFVSQEIVAPGVAQGVFRDVNPEATAVLLMNVYLGTGSQVDDSGRPWLDPGQVADFALHALRRGNPAPGK